jgi:hypothetical protein
MPENTNSWMAKALTDVVREERLYLYGDAKSSKGKRRERIRDVLDEHFSDYLSGDSSDAEAESDSK